MKEPYECACRCWKNRMLVAQLSWIRLPACFDIWAEGNGTQPPEMKTVWKQKNILELNPSTIEVAIMLVPRDELLKDR
jgi:hypothetical protein